MVAPLAAGLILFKTHRNTTGGETTAGWPTVGLYASYFLLFTSLLSWFGSGSSDD